MRSLVLCVLTSYFRTDHLRIPTEILKDLVRFDDGHAQRRGEPRVHPRATQNYASSCLTIRGSGWLLTDAAYLHAGQRRQPQKPVPERRPFLATRRTSCDPHSGQVWSPGSCLSSRLIASCSSANAFRTSARDSRARAASSEASRSNNRRCRHLRSTAHKETPFRRPRQAAYAMAGLGEIIAKCRRATLSQLRSKTSREGS